MGAAQVLGVLLAERHALDGEAGGLLSDDDIALAGDLLEPGSAAALVVWEDRWAAPLAHATVGDTALTPRRRPATPLVCGCQATTGVRTTSPAMRYSFGGSTPISHFTK